MTNLRSKALVVWSAVFVGAFIRLICLDTHSLWFDENMTVYIAKSNDMISVLERDRNPPLAFLLYRAWIDRLGESDVALRLLPALVSTLSLVLVAVILPRVVSGWAAALAVCLLAVSPCNIWYGQEVRTYFLLEMGAAAHTLGLLWLHRKTTHNSAGIALTMAGSFIAIGSNYTGYLLISQAAGLALFMCFTGGRAPARRVVAASLGGLSLWGMWIVIVLPRQLGNSWGAPASPGIGGFIQLPARLILVQADAVPDSVWWVPWACVLLIATGLLVASWGIIIRSIEVVYMILFAAPFVAAITVAISAFPMLGTRYLLPAELPLLIFLSLGICDLYSKLRLPFAAVLLVSLATISLSHKTRNLREDYRYACGCVAANWAPGDRVVSITGTSEGFSQSGLTHYLRGRKDILDSIISEKEVMHTVVSGRLHIVFREAPYSWGRYNEVMAICSPISEEPMRNRVQYVLVHKEE